jgi:hypothetical protein
LNEWTAITGDKRLGLLMAGGGGGVIYPTTAAAFAAATGYTPAALYLFDETSGNVQDQVGAAHLTVNSSPTFSSIQGGRQGVYYDANGDSHRADVHALGTTPFILGTVYAQVAALTAAASVSGRRGGDNPGYFTQYNNAAATTPNSFMRGAATVNVQAAPTLDTASNMGRPLLYQMQRDNTGSRLRARASPSWSFTATRQQEGAIDPAQNTDGVTTPTFGTGALTGINATGLWVGYMFLITGAAAEGASALQTIAQRLGWE